MVGRWRRIQWRRRFGGLVMIASWLSSYANENDLREIEAAVAQAETKTAGEIVPMVVRTSTLSGHVPVIGALLAFSFFMIVIPFLISRVPGPEWVYDIAAVFLSFVFGWAMAKSAWVRRAFTSARDQELSVLNRAQLEFHETGIPLTEGRTGILIFVSLQERRAVILGDESISKKLDEKTWIEIVDDLLRHMKSRDLRGGFIEAIQKVGTLLEREFPIKPNDTNELPNSLIVKD
jgi:putative membrane protein